MTFMPAMTALAGLVPWADCGIRQSSGALPPRMVLRSDHEQSGVLALRSRVRLERHRVEPGDLGQLLLELPEEQLVARRLVARREGMQPVEFRARSPESSRSSR